MGPNGPQPNTQFQDYQKELKKLGKTDVTQNVALGGNEFIKAVGKGAGEAFTKRQEDARAAVGTLRNISEGRRLLDSGMITGAGADSIVKGGQILKTMGIPIGETAEQTIANTQAFAANMGREVGNVIRAFGSGTGLSDADREYAEKIAGGRITLDEQAIRKLLDINERVAKAKINEYNKQAEELLKSDQGKQLIRSMMIVDVPKEISPPKVRRYNPKTGRIE